jgi:hypothetical protein
MAALVLALAAAHGTGIHLALDPDGIDVDDILGQVVPPAAGGLDDRCRR